MGQKLLGRSNRVISRPIAGTSRLSIQAVSADGAGARYRRSPNVICCASHDRRPGVLTVKSELRLPLMPFGLGDRGHHKADGTSGGQHTCRIARGPRRVSILLLLRCMNRPRAAGSPHLSGDHWTAGALNRNDWSNTIRV